MKISHLNPWHALILLIDIWNIWTIFNIIRSLSSIIYRNKTLKEVMIDFVAIRTLMLEWVCHSLTFKVFIVDHTLPWIRIYNLFTMNCTCRQVWCASVLDYRSVSQNFQNLMLMTLMSRSHLSRALTLSISLIWILPFSRINLITQWYHFWIIISKLKWWYKYQLENVD